MLARALIEDQQREMDKMRKVSQTSWAYFKETLLDAIGSASGTDLSETGNKLRASRSAEVVNRDPRAMWKRMAAYARSQVRGSLAIQAMKDDLKRTESISDSVKTFERHTQPNRQRRNALVIRQGSSDNIQSLENRSGCQARRDSVTFNMDQSNDRFKTSEQDVHRQASAHIAGEDGVQPLQSNIFDANTSAFRADSVSSSVNIRDWVTEFCTEILAIFQRKSFQSSKKDDQSVRAGQSRSINSRSSMKTVTRNSSASLLAKFCRKKEKNSISKSSPLEHSWWHDPVNYIQLATQEEPPSTHVSDLDRTRRARSTLLFNSLGPEGSDLRLMNKDRSLGPEGSDLRLMNKDRSLGPDGSDLRLMNKDRSRLCVRRNIKIVADLAGVDLIKFQRNVTTGKSSIANSSRVEDVRGLDLMAKGEPMQLDETSKIGKKPNTECLPGSQIVDSSAHYPAKVRRRRERENDFKAKPSSRESGKPSYSVAHRKQDTLLSTNPVSNLGISKVVTEKYEPCKVKARRTKEKENNQTSSRKPESTAHLCKLHASLDKDTHVRKENVCGLHQDVIGCRTENIGHHINVSGGEATDIYMKYTDTTPTSTDISERLITPPEANDTVASNKNLKPARALKILSDITRVITKRFQQIDLKMKTTESSDRSSGNEARHFSEISSRQENVDRDILETSSFRKDSPLDNITSLVDFPDASSQSNGSTEHKTQKGSDNTEHRKQKAPECTEHRKRTASTNSEHRKRTAPDSTERQTQKASYNGEHRKRRVSDSTERQTEKESDSNSHKNHTGSDSSELRKQKTLCRTNRRKQKTSNSIERLKRKISDNTECPQQNKSNNTENRKQTSLDITESKKQKASDNIHSKINIGSDGTDHLKKKTSDRIERRQKNTDNTERRKHKAPDSTEHRKQKASDSNEHRKQTASDSTERQEQKPSDITGYQNQKAPDSTEHQTRKASDITDDQTQTVADSTECEDKNAAGSTERHKQKAPDSAALRKKKTLHNAEHLKQQASDNTEHRKRASLDRTESQEQKTSDSSDFQQQKTSESKGHQQQKTSESTEHQQQEVSQGPVTSGSTELEKTETSESTGYQLQETSDSTGLQQQETSESTEYQKSKASVSIERRKHKASDSSERRKQKASDSSEHRKQKTSDSHERRKQKVSDSTEHHKQKASDSTEHQKQKASDNTENRKQTASDSTERQKQKTPDSKKTRQKQKPSDNTEFHDQEETGLNSKKQKLLDNTECQTHIASETTEHRKQTASDRTERRKQKTSDSTDLQRPKRSDSTEYQKQKGSDSIKHQKRTALNNTECLKQKTSDSTEHRKRTASDSTERGTRKRSDSTELRKQKAQDSTEHQRQKGADHIENRKRTSSDDTECRTHTKSNSAEHQQRKSSDDTERQRLASESRKYKKQKGSDSTEHRKRTASARNIHRKQKAGSTEHQKQIVSDSTKGQEQKTSGSTEHQKHRKWTASDSTERLKQSTSYSNERLKLKASDSTERRKRKGSVSNERRKQESSDSTERAIQKATFSTERQKQKASDGTGRLKQTTSDGTGRQEQKTSDSTEHRERTASDSTEHRERTASDSTKHQKQKQSISTELPKQKASNSTERGKRGTTDSTEHQKQKASDSTEHPKQKPSDSTEHPKHKASDSTERRKQKASVSNERPKQKASDSTERPKQKASDSTEHPKQKASDSIERPKQKASDSTERWKQKALDSTECRKQKTTNSNERQKNEVSVGTKYRKQTTSDSADCRKQKKADSTIETRQKSSDRQYTTQYSEKVDRTELHDKVYAQLNGTGLLLEASSSVADSTQCAKAIGPMSAAVGPHTAVRGPTAADGGPMALCALGTSLGTIDSAKLLTIENDKHSKRTASKNKGTLCNPHVSSGRMDITKSGNTFSGNADIVNITGQGGSTSSNVHNGRPSTRSTHLNGASSVRCRLASSRQEETATTGLECFRLHSDSSLQPNLSRSSFSREPVCDEPTSKDVRKSSRISFCSQIISREIKRLSTRKTTKKKIPSQTVSLELQFRKFLLAKKIERKLHSEKNEVKDYLRNVSFNAIGSLRPYKNKSTRNVTSMGTCFSKAMKRSNDYQKTAQWEGTMRKSWTSSSRAVDTNSTQKAGSSSLCGESSIKSTNADAQKNEVYSCNAMSKTETSTQSAGDMLKTEDDNNFVNVGNDSVASENEFTPQSGIYRYGTMSAKQRDKALRDNTLERDEILTRQPEDAKEVKNFPLSETNQHTVRSVLNLRCRFVRRQYEPRNESKHYMVGRCFEKIRGRPMMDGYIRLHKDYATPTIQQPTVDDVNSASRTDGVASAFEIHDAISASRINPMVHLASGTIYSTRDCMHMELDNAASKSGIHDTTTASRVDDKISTSFNDNAQELDAKTSTETYFLQQAGSTMPAYVHDTTPLSQRFTDARDATVAAGTREYAQIMAEIEVNRNASATNAQDHVKFAAGPKTASSHNMALEAEAGKREVGKGDGEGEAAMVDEEYGKWEEAHEEERNWVERTSMRWRPPEDAEYAMQLSDWHVYGLRT